MLDDYAGFDPELILGTIFYAVLGFFLMLTFTFFFDKILKVNMQKELLEEHNVALALLIGAVSIATAIIIAASIAG